jgi:hypothetical protein
MTGRTETGKTAAVSVNLPSAPAMRQVYYLSLESFLNQTGWWKFIQNREYLCLQRPVWDMLEIAIPRKPRGHICDGWVICSMLKEAVGLVTNNGALPEIHSNNLRGTPLIKHATELSQMACHVNKAVEESLSLYQCENLIIGPSERNTSYRINESIPAKNIYFDLQHQ